MNNPKMNNMLSKNWLRALVLIVMSLSCFTALGKKPVLKNTTWTAHQEMFVADAGTMTITYTLEFVSAKEVKIKEVSVMPSHPAMYMNPDGTVDRIPGWTNEREEAGTYLFKKGILNVRLEDGRERVYFLQPDGTFTTTAGSIVDELLVFSKEE